MRITNILIGADSWGEISPEILERGVGGREGAMLYLSEQWAKLGHQVTNFVNVNKAKRIEGEDGGYHEYVPLNICRPMLAHFPWDVGIAWERPSAFNDDRIKEQVKLRICEMQVAHFNAGETKAAEENCHYVAALSTWHGEFLLHSGLAVDPERVVVFPNGVSMARYPEEAFNRKVEAGPKRDEPFFVYSSSPDRGLWQLLQAWPLIRKEFPKAELAVAYGVKNYIAGAKWRHDRLAKMALELERLMDQPGVTDIGKVGQGDLAKLQISADAWLYPMDSIQPTETGCITAVENAAAGNPLVISDGDCLEEEFGRFSIVHELPFDAERYAEQVSSALEPETWRNMALAGRTFAETRNWNGIAKRWVNLFGRHQN